MEVQPSLVQSRRLRRRQHAERPAGLDTETLYGADHVADLVKIAVLRTAPGRGHAETAGTGFLGALRLGNHVRPVHQARRFEAHSVLRALRAIAAVFRAAGGLDAEQTRGLDMVRIEMGAVNALSLKHQVGERQGTERLGFQSKSVRMGIALRLSFRLAFASSLISSLSARNHQASRAGRPRPMPMATRLGGIVRRHTGVTADD
jgi:hypothetical protein